MSRDISNKDQAPEPDDISELDRKDREIRADGEATAIAVSTNAPGTLGSHDSAAVEPVNTVRPVKTDALLRQGEDLFSSGMYQQAIHVWTRILFLERGNNEARKAIERGKQAVAERQRLLDEELAAASHLLERGKIDEAAGKARYVLSVDPRHREGHHFAERIARLSRRSEPSPGSKEREADASERVLRPKRGLLLRVSRSRAAKRRGSNASPLKMAGFALGTVLVFAVAALYLRVNWESIVSDGAFATGALTPDSSSLPVAAPPGASELRYYNGARLFAKGRYREALDELRLVERSSAISEQARSLVLRIEERLLRGASDSEQGPPEKAEPN